MQEVMRASKAALDGDEDDVANEDDDEDDDDDNSGTIAFPEKSSSGRTIKPSSRFQDQ